MLEVIRQSFHENFKLTVVHGFDDEFAVVGEEEEAAGFSLAFSSFKCLVPISLSGQRILDFSFVNVVHVTNLLEYFGSKFVNCNFFVYGQHIAFLLSIGD